MSTARALAFLSVLTACGTASREEAPTVEEDILGGRISTRDQNAVVMIGKKYQSGAGGWFVEHRCSGTLVDRRVVLTALHCIGAPNYRKYTGVDVRGTSTCADGRQSGAVGDYELEAPSDFVVKVGADLRGKGFIEATGVFPADALGPEASVRAWVLPEHQCIFGSDVAALVLDRPIEGVPVAPLRKTRARADEADLTAVGWGYKGDRFQEDNTLVRRQRRGLRIETVGPRDFSDDPWDFDHRLAATEFRLSERGVICYGDSGGALFDSSGALVGVISRGDDAVCSQGLAVVSDASKFAGLVKKAVAIR